MTYTRTSAPDGNTIEYVITDPHSPLESILFHTTDAKEGNKQVVLDVSVFIVTKKNDAGMALMKKIRGMRTISQPRGWSMMEALEESSAQDTGRDEPRMSPEIDIQANPDSNIKSILAISEIPNLLQLELMREIEAAWTKMPGKGRAAS